MANTHDHIPVVQAFVVDDSQPTVFNSFTTQASFHVNLPQTPPPRPAPIMNTVNESRVRDYLSKHNWPYGLQDSVVNGLKKIPLRYFICDDSGSMNESDGSRLVYYNGKFSFVPCSRWAELVQALKFHVGLAAASETVSEFRMLNSAAPLKISPESPHNFEVFSALLDSSPGGGTPLCRHIREVIADIKRYEPYLRANGQKACVVIATDGESSDGDIAEALRPLEQLPCWVVVRLCTNEDKIVRYWNSIESAIELEMEVLDDFESEAKEVNEKNPWITYGDPLHKIREFGIQVKAFDLLDEKTLTGEQIRSMMHNVFGGDINAYPSPDVDIKGFFKFLDIKQRDVPEVWDPLTKKLSPWIKKKQLISTINPKGDCSIM